LKEWRVGVVERRRGGKEEKKTEGEENKKKAKPGKFARNN
jgi:hypothetical protein